MHLCNRLSKFKTTALAPSPLLTLHQQGALPDSQNIPEVHAHTLATKVLLVPSLLSVQPRVLPWPLLAVPSTPPPTYPTQTPPQLYRPAVPPNPGPPLGAEIRDHPPPPGHSKSPSQLQITLEPEQTPAASTVSQPRNHLELSTRHRTSCRTKSSLRRHGRPGVAAQTQPAGLCTAQHTSLPPIPCSWPFPGGRPRHTHQVPRGGRMIWCPCGHPCPEVLPSGSPSQRTQKGGPSRHSPAAILAALA